MNENCTGQNGTVTLKKMGLKRSLGKNQSVKQRMFAKQRGIEKQPSSIVSVDLMDFDKKKS